MAALIINRAQLPAALDLRADQAAVDACL
jgi:hypothetical protein